jgi:phage I-like protein
MTGPSSQIALCSAAALADGNGVPEWVHLLPAGPVHTIDGRGPYNIASLQSLAAKLRAGQKLVIDECHATDLAAKRGKPAPARGWIVALQARSDGLWGRVEWTNTGRQLVADKAYRGISPVIKHDGRNTVTEVLRASLTNLPNIANLVALHSREEQSFRPTSPSLTEQQKSVCALMGIPEASYLQAMNEERGVALHSKAISSLSDVDRNVCSQLGIALTDYVQTRDTSRIALQAQHALNDKDQPTKGKLTSQESEICAKLGISETAYLKSRDGVAAGE